MGLWQLHRVASVSDACLHSSRQRRGGPPASGTDSQAFVSHSFATAPFHVSLPVRCHSLDVIRDLRDEQGG